MKILYAFKFYDAGGQLNKEIITVARDIKDYETACKDWSGFTMNVKVEKLLVLDDDEASSIARKIAKWDKEDAEEEHANPRYEVSPLII